MPLGDEVQATSRIDYVTSRIGTQGTTGMGCTHHLMVVATRKRLMGFEEPSESGVVGGPSAHQGYLQ